MRKWLVVSLALAVVGCNDNGGKGNNNPDMTGGNNNGGGNFSVVSRNTTLVVGSTECANGGTRVDIGLDNGDGGGTARDGTLQDGEIDSSTNICNPTVTTFTTLTSMSPLMVGDPDCMFGGTLIHYGLDNGDSGGVANNGILEQGEIDGMTKACLTAPDDVVVVTTPLFAGDPVCPYGGTNVKSGFDDGKPGGTAGDGILDPQEVDLTTNNCNKPPTDVFADPGGPIGSASINASSGFHGPGIGTAYPNEGGQIEVVALGGPLAASVEARKNGTVAMPMAPADPTFTAGTNPVVISTDTSITSYYLTGDDVIPTEGVALVYPVNWLLFDGPKLYNNGVAATSLHVAADVTLTIETADTVVLTVDGDVWNEGRIGTRYGEGSGTPSLYIVSHNFINDTNAIIDLGSESSGSLYVLAVGKPGAAALNRGALRTDGFDYNYDDSNNGGSGGGEIVFAARGDVTNRGTISTTGGDGGTDGESTYPALSGGAISIFTAKGNVYTDGTVNSTGGAGFFSSGASAGNIRIFNGYYGGLGNSIPSLFYDETERGPGSIAVGGEIIAEGGESNDGNGATGGYIVVRAVGGAVRITGYLDARGGNVNEADFDYTGSGGRIFVAALTLVTSSAPNDPIVPEGIFIGPPPGATAETQGSLDARGGDHTSSGEGTGIYSGGDGGDIGILLDATLSYGFADARIGNGGDGEWIINRSFDLTKLSATGRTPRIQLLGQGNNLVARGGDADAVNAGWGGSIYLRNNVCGFASDTLCALASVGARLIHTDCALDTRGGTSTTIASQGGGYVELELAAGNNLVPAVFQSTLLDVAGPVRANSPDSDQTTLSYDGSYGGQISLSANSGQIDVSGLLDVSGGQVGTVFDQGDGGSVSIEGFLIDLRGTIDATGATSSGTPLFAGRNGRVAAQGYRVTVASSGLIDSSGRNQSTIINPNTYIYTPFNIFLNGANQITNSGTLRANGLGMENEGLGSRGGIIHLISLGPVVNTGTVEAIGTSWAVGTSDLSAGNGGEIYAEGSSCTQGGTFDASGGEGLSGGYAEGGYGGRAQLFCAGGMNAGTVRANGGKAGNGTTTTDAYGGNGGSVYVNIPNNGTLAAIGGPVAGPAADGTGELIAGDGGTVVPANNLSTIDVSGGFVTGTGAADAVYGGDGGYIEFDGAATNSGCMKISGGDGAAGSDGEPGSYSPEELTNSCT